MLNQLVDKIISAEKQAEQEAEAIMLLTDSLMAEKRERFKSEQKAAVEKIYSSAESAAAKSYDNVIKDAGITAAKIKSIDKKKTQQAVDLILTKVLD